MRNGHRSTATTRYYQLPVAAYVTLQNTRDHLRLLNQLTDSRSEDDRDHIVVSAGALADAFHRVADELDTALQSVSKD